MNDELTALAQAGAVAVVAAMATELWQSTRDTVLGLFQRAAPGRRTAIEAQLDSNATLVRATAPSDDLRQALHGFWTRELAGLLRSDPTCREPLARLAAEVGRALPDGRRAPVLTQTNTAHDSAEVFAVQGGDLHIHRRDRDGAAPGAE
ncbi:hypothetical protein [Streptomyces palmae]|uniref:Uncharacterized protein n=1 Tax=Streptomyces palmae TaxID=1701085 RepID=A0A4Z0H920_9ACTN|nr:hypothetical protein [Streptomyces palmae]TGB05781.1 hypothetical protein E4099_18865 [Streptomyces palmae]